VKRTKLEAYMADLYADTAEFVRQNPYPILGEPAAAPRTREPNERGDRAEDTPAADHRRGEIAG
jgi:hypothetical protein